MADSHKLTALQTAGLGRSGGLAKSPTKGGSPAGIRAVSASVGQLSDGAGIRFSFDDVTYRQADSTRPTDQEAGGGPDHEHVRDAAPQQGAAQGGDRPSKYISLLSSAYPPTALSSGTAHNSLKLRQPGSAAAAAVAPGRPQHVASRSTSTGGHEAHGAPLPLRSSASPKGVTTQASSGSTPLARRSMGASILDTSQGGSLIPASPTTAPLSAATTTSSGSSTTLEQQQQLAAPRAAGGRAAPGGSPATSPGAANRALRSSAGASGGMSRILSHKEPGSPVRRSTPAAAAQAKPQYAFGCRIEPPAATTAAASTPGVSVTGMQRRPSPNRVPVARAVLASSGHSSGSLLGAAAAGIERGHRARTAASPQRLPAAARASALGAAAASGAAAAAARSTSAPRMSSADKAQSRFTQHAVSAAAAQRSKTPNPAQRIVAGSAAATATSASPVAGSSTTAARRLRASAVSAAESRHIARMQRNVNPAALAAGSSGRVHGSTPMSSYSLRSPSKGAAGIAHAGAFGSASPIALRAGTAGATAHNSRSLIASAGPCGRVIPTAPAGLGSRPGPRGERMTMAFATAAAAASSTSATHASTGSSAVVIPVIQDRYRNLYKHTPAALAVAEAHAAAGENTTGPTRPAGVPRLSLGSLLQAPAAPTAAAAADTTPVQHQQQQRQERQPCAPRTESPCTPVPAAGGLLPGAAAGGGFSDIEFTPLSGGQAAYETPDLLVKQQPRIGGSSGRSHTSSGYGGEMGSPRSSGSSRLPQQEGCSPPLAPRNLLGSNDASAGKTGGLGGSTQPQDLPGADAYVWRRSSGSSGVGAGAGPGSVAAAAKSLALPLFKLQEGDLQPLGAAATAGGGSSAGQQQDELPCESPPKHRRGGPDPLEGPSPDSHTKKHQQQLPLKSRASALGGHHHGGSSSSSVAAGAAAASSPMFAAGAAAKVTPGAGVMRASTTATGSSSGSAGKHGSGGASSGSKVRSRIGAAAGGSSSSNAAGQPIAESCRSRAQDQQQQHDVRRSLGAVTSSPAPKVGLLGSMGGLSTPSPAGAGLSQHKGSGLPSPRYVLRVPVACCVLSDVC